MLVKEQVRSLGKEWRPMWQRAVVWDTTEAVSSFTVHSVGIRSDTVERKMPKAPTDA